MTSHTSKPEIRQVGDAEVEDAARLLVRFFAEEGFDTPPEVIVARAQQMRRDPRCWMALAFLEGEPAGIAAVSTMFYIESGELAELGDLYVTPGARGRGVARALVEAAADWSRGRSCTALSVVTTPDGEARHGLSGFYRGLGFVPTGRTIAVREF